MSAHFDVIVVGGGPAGLSAAGVHDLLGQEGTAPRELVRVGHQEVARYGVTVTDGRIVAASASPVTDDDTVGFRLALTSGEVVATRCVDRRQRRQLLLLLLLLRERIRDHLHRTPASMAGRLSDIIAPSASRPELPMVGGRRYS